MWKLLHFGKRKKKKPGAPPDRHDSSAGSSAVSLAGLQTPGYERNGPLQDAPPIAIGTPSSTHHSQQPSVQNIQQPGSLGRYVPNEYPLSFPVSPDGRVAAGLDASTSVINHGNTTLITGGQPSFHYGPNIYITSQVDPHSMNSTIQNMRRSHNAEYDMTVNAARGPCTPQTRVVILEGLMEWSTSGIAMLYWMSGMAGTGKTTIMYSFCQMLADKKLLGASFFCSRSLPDCRDVNIIFPTIAFQLARRYSPFGEALFKVLQDDVDIVHRGLDAQLLKLIIEPWTSRKDNLPLNIVVGLDALDECDEHHSKFLQVLFRNVTALPFKLMVTSRPEFSIRRTVLAKDSNTLSTFVLHEVEASLVKEDIVRYIESELMERLPSCPRSDILRLAAQCDTFFIYAATFCRFITDDEGDDVARLQSLLELSSSDIHERAVEPINELYKQILGRVLSEKKARSEVEGIKLVLDTIVCAREPLTRDAIAGLLQLSLAEVESRLKSLRSFIFVPEALDQPLTTFHASFVDFMLVSSRSQQFHCQPQVCHLDLSKRSLTLMGRELSQNLCQLMGRPPNNTIQDEVVKRHISPGLRYASNYWAEHWSLSDHLERQMMSGSIHDFLATSGLHWFECLSLIARLAVGISSLERLHDTLHENAGLTNLTHDYLQFIQRVYDTIEHSAMETYFSALAWIPSQSVLRTHHASLFNQAPQVLCGVAATWTGPDQVIHIHPGTITSIAISRDGRYVTSGSDDQNLRIWNVHSHIEECALGHTNSVYSVAISRNGSYAVSGSSGGDVRVWNTATQEGVFTLRSESDVYAVALSPDGKWIASGHHDNLVRVWDTTNSRLIHSLQGHTGCVRSVSFTPDNAQLISGSDDETAHIWSVTMGTMEYILRGHTDYVSSVACSPKGDKIVTGSIDKTLRLWDMSGKQFHVLHGHSDGVNCVAFIPDGSQVISGSRDKTLRVWDATSGDTVHIFTGLADEVTSVAAFPDGL